MMLFTFILFLFKCISSSSHFYLQSAELLSVSVKDFTTIYGCTSGRKERTLSHPNGFMSGSWVTNDPDLTAVDSLSVSSDGTFFYLQTVQLYSWDYPGENSTSYDFTQIDSARGGRLVGLDGQIYKFTMSSNTKDVISSGSGWTYVQTTEDFESIFAIKDQYLYKFDTGTNWNLISDEIRISKFSVFQPHDQIFILAVDLTGSSLYLMRYNGRPGSPWILFTPTGLPPGEVIHEVSVAKDSSVALLVGTIGALGYPVYVNEGLFRNASCFGVHSNSSQSCTGNGFCFEQNVCTCFRDEYLDEKCSLKNGLEMISGHDKGSLFTGDSQHPAARRANIFFHDINDAHGFYLGFGTNGPDRSDLWYFNTTTRVWTMLFDNDDENWASSDFDSLNQPGRCQHPSYFTTNSSGFIFGCYISGVTCPNAGKLSEFSFERREWRLAINDSDEGMSVGGTIGEYASNVHLSNASAGISGFFLKSRNSILLAGGINYLPSGEYVGYGNLVDIWEYSIALNQFRFLSGPRSTGQTKVKSSSRNTFSPLNLPSRLMDCHWGVSDEMWYFWDTGEMWVLNITSFEWKYLDFPTGASPGGKMYRKEYQLENTPGNTGADVHGWRDGEHLFVCGSWYNPSQGIFSFSTVQNMWRWEGFGGKTAFSTASLNGESDVMGPVKAARAMKLPDRALIWVGYDDGDVFETDYLWSYVCDDCFGVVEYELCDEVNVFCVEVDPGYPCSNCHAVTVQGLVNSLDSSGGYMIYLVGSNSTQVVLRESVVINVGTPENISLVNTIQPYPGHSIQWKNSGDQSILLINSDYWWKITGGDGYLEFCNEYTSVNIPMFSFYTDGLFLENFVLKNYVHVLERILWFESGEGDLKGLLIHGLTFVDTDTVLYIEPLFLEHMCNGLCVNSSFTDFYGEDKRSWIKGNSFLIPSSMYIIGGTPQFAIEGNYFLLNDIGRAIVMNMYRATDGISIFNNVFHVVGEVGELLNMWYYEEGHFSYAGKNLFYNNLIYVDDNGKLELVFDAQIYSGCGLYHERFDVYNNIFHSKECFPIAVCYDACSSTNLRVWGNRHSNISCEYSLTDEEDGCHSSFLIEGYGQNAASPVFFNSTGDFPYPFFDLIVDVPGKSIEAEYPIPSIDYLGRPKSVLRPPSKGPFEFQCPSHCLVGGRLDCQRGDTCGCVDVNFGLSCEFEFDIVKCGGCLEGNCTTNGTSEEYSCICRDNFFGDDCSVTTCYEILSNDSESVCSGNGFCFEKDVCTCSFDYKGEQCEQRRVRGWRRKGTGKGDQPTVNSTVDLSIYDPDTIPGSRFAGCMVQISDCEVIYFFGSGHGFRSVSSYLNEVWIFNFCIQQYRKVRGSGTEEEFSEIDVMGEYSSIAIPGSRWGQTCAKINEDEVVLFGGNGRLSSGSVCFLDDVWYYNISSNQFMFKNGKDPVEYPLPVFSQFRVHDEFNSPGGIRTTGGHWDWDAFDVRIGGEFTNLGQFYIFGGAGFDTSGHGDYKTNNLFFFDGERGAEGGWKYGMWRYEFGNTSLYDAIGVYADKGIYSVGFPGSRFLHASAQIYGDEILVFGGVAAGEDGILGSLNDVWIYKVSYGQWKWVSGCSTYACALGATIFPTHHHQYTETANPGNSADILSSYISESREFLIGFPQDCNNLWSYSVVRNEWEVLSGTSSYYNTNPVKPIRGKSGTYDVFDVNHLPGSRYDTPQNMVVVKSSEIDGLVFFGGIGCTDSSCSYAKLQDAWTYGSKKKVTCFGIQESNMTYVCSGHGCCVDDDYCVCMDKYFGDDCSVPSCYSIIGSISSQACSGHGSCISRPDNCECSDPENYFGDDCSVTTCSGILSNDTANVCSGGHGFCFTKDFCNCSFGYTGSNCEGRAARYWRRKGSGISGNTVGTNINQFADDNLPGSRYYTCSVKINDCEMILFFGNGRGITGTGNNRRNEVWRYNFCRRQFKYIRGITGEETALPSFVGTMGTFSASNEPGGRAYFSCSRIDDDDNSNDDVTVIGLVGGFGVRSNSSQDSCNLDDVWYYNVTSSEFMLKNGGGTCDSEPEYSVFRNHSSENRIGGMRFHSGGFWKNINGDVGSSSSNRQLYLFGGSSKFGAWNHLFLFDESLGDDGMWRWEFGSRIMNDNGVYVDKGEFSTRSYPSARNGMVACQASPQELLVFGGSDRLNDVWIYHTTLGQWKWASGGDQTYPEFNVSQLYEYDSQNIPFSQWYGISLFLPSSREFLVGFGRVLPSDVMQNSIWSYSVIRNEWMLVSGDFSSYGMANVCRRKGTSDFEQLDKNHLPGANQGAVSLIRVQGSEDGDGGFYLDGILFFGGHGVDPAGIVDPLTTTFRLQDVWTLARNGNAECFGVHSSDVLNVCSGRGSCVDTDLCDCDENLTDDETWIGPDCSWYCYSIPSSNIDDVCGGHGSCVSPDNCSCSDPEDYFGDDCSVTTCSGFLSNDSSNVCSGHGFCFTKNACNCSFGFRGDHCEKFTPRYWKRPKGTGITNGPTLEGISILEYDDDNLPGGRYSGCVEKINECEMILFMGNGNGLGGYQPYRNDMWKYNFCTHQFKLLKGTSDDAVAYAESTTKGEFNNTNIPGGRINTMCARISDDEIAVIGGSGYASSGDVGLLDDIWIYNMTSNEFMFTSGSISDTGESTEYASFRRHSPNNKIGGMKYHSGGRWYDNYKNNDGSTSPNYNGKLGQIVVFGGNGGKNHLFFFDITQGEYGEWRWEFGTKDAISVDGKYEEKGKFSNLSYPGGRLGSLSAQISSDDFMVITGKGDDKNGVYCSLDDVWIYRISLGQWKWVSGSDVCPTVYSANVENDNKKYEYDPLNRPIPFGYGIGTYIRSSKEFIAGFGYVGLDQHNSIWSYSVIRNEWMLLSGDLSSFIDVPHTEGDLEITDFDKDHLPPSMNSPHLKFVVIKNELLDGLMFFGGYLYSDTKSQDVWVFGYNTNATCFNSDNNDADCSGSGFCVDDDLCECTESSSMFIGRDCSWSCYSVLSSTDSVCGSHGSCVSPDNCSCSDAEDYFGDDCSVTTCSGFLSNDSSNVCSGHGFCIRKNSCNCSFGFRGDQCEIFTARYWKRPKGSGIVDGNTIVGLSGNITEYDDGHLPGGRYAHCTVMINDCVILLYGGHGYGNVGSRTMYSRNELWKYDFCKQKFKLLRGNPDAGKMVSYYAVKGEYNELNIPSGRFYIVCGKMHNSNEFAIVGGMGYYSDTASVYLDEVWMYNITSNQFMFKNGEGVKYPAAEYGAFRRHSSSNKIGGIRYQTLGTWNDENEKVKSVGKLGQFYIFGGRERNEEFLNHLFFFDSTIGEYGEWRWEFGKKDDTDMKGNYVDKGEFSDSSYPGAHLGSLTAQISPDELIVFSGTGIDHYSQEGHMNDVWIYSVSLGRWKWVSGSDTIKPAYHLENNENYKYHPLNSPEGVGYGSGAFLPKSKEFLAGLNQANVNDVTAYDNSIWSYSLIRNEWMVVSGDVVYGQFDVCRRKGDREFTEFDKNHLPSSLYRASKQLTVFSDADGLDGILFFGGNGIDPGCTDTKGVVGRSQELWVFAHNTSATCYGHKPGYIDPVSCGALTQGYCVDTNNCQCYDDLLWTGENCDLRVCYSVREDMIDEVCSGNGNCTNPNDCTCNREHIGDQCELTFCNGTMSNDTNNVCSGNGECLWFDFCNCTYQEYYGDDCEIPMCFNQTIEEEICSNHGSCEDVNTCECDVFYNATEDCQWNCYGVIHSSEDVCSGHGACKGHDNCTCVDDNLYGGEYCQYWSCFEISALDSDRTCGGHGSCVAVDICFCQAGYFSDDVNGPCEHWTCDKFFHSDKDACNKRGSCDEFGKCTCKYDYEGDYCETWSCGFDYQSPLTCSAHGKCTSPKKCKCESGFRGDLCQENMMYYTVMAPILGSAGIFVFLIILCLLLLGLCCILVFFCFLVLSGMAVLGLVTAVVGQKFKMKKFGKLKNVDILIKEQELEEDTSIAHIRVNQKLFEVDYNDIKIISILGEGGSMSVVYKAKYRGKIVAFKCFKTRTICSSQNTFDEFEREVQILSSVSSPGILRFFGCCMEPPRVGIIMEYCSGGDLNQFYGNYNQKENGRRYPFYRKLIHIQEIAQSLDYLHVRKIIHRDLKMDNVLVDSKENTKLMDFGLSKMVERMSQRQTSRVGTSVYMCPEIINGDIYDHKIDIFSFGVMMFIIVTELLTSPYENISEFQIEMRVATNPDLRPRIGKVDEVLIFEKNENDDDVSYDLSWLKDLIVRSWQHDPDERPDCSEIGEILQKHIQNFENCVEKYDDESMASQSFVPMKETGDQEAAAPVMSMKQRMKIEREKDEKILELENFKRKVMGILGLGEDVEMGKVLSSMEKMASQSVKKEKRRKKKKKKKKKKKEEDSSDDDDDDDDDDDEGSSEGSTDESDDWAEDF